MTGGIKTHKQENHNFYGSPGAWYVAPRRALFACEVDFFWMVHSKTKFVLFVPANDRKLPDGIIQFLVNKYVNLACNYCYVCINLVCQSLNPIYSISFLINKLKVKILGND